MIGNQRNQLFFKYYGLQRGHLWQYMLSAYPFCFFDFNQILIFLIYKLQNSKQPNTKTASQTKLFHLPPKKEDMRAKYINNPYQTSQVVKSSQSIVNPFVPLVYVQSIQHLMRQHHLRLAHQHPPPQGLTHLLSRNEVPRRSRGRWGDSGLVGNDCIGWELATDLLVTVFHECEVDVEKVGGEAGLLAEVEDVEMAHHAAEVYVGPDEEVDIGGGRNRPLLVELFDFRLLNLPETLEDPFADILTFLQRNHITHLYFILLYLCLVLLFLLAHYLILQKELAIELLPIQPVTILLKCIVENFRQMLNTCLFGCLFYKFLYLSIGQKLLDSFLLCGKECYDCVVGDYFFFDGIEEYIRDASQDEAEYVPRQRLHPDDPVHLLHIFLLGHLRQLCQIRRQQREYFLQILPYYFSAISQQFQTDSREYIDCQPPDVIIDS